MSEEDFIEYLQQNAYNKDIIWDPAKNLFTYIPAYNISNKECNKLIRNNCCSFKATDSNTPKRIRRGLKSESLLQGTRTWFEAVETRGLG